VRRRKRRRRRKKVVLPRFWCRFAIRRSSFLAGEPKSTVIAMMNMVERERLSWGEWWWRVDFVFWGWCMMWGWRKERVGEKENRN
jgi:hypothetical protein